MNIRTPHPRPNSIFPCVSSRRFFLRLLSLWLAVLSCGGTAEAGPPEGLDSAPLAGEGAKQSAIPSPLYTDLEGAPAGESEGSEATPNVFGRQTPLSDLLANHPLLADNSRSLSPSSSLRPPLEPPTSLPEVTVAGSSGSVLPSDYNVDSAYGYSTNVIDAPRSIQIITKEEIQQSAFISQNVMSMMYMAPGLYTGSAYGEFAIPNIRGMPAGKFINGMASFLPGAGGQGGPMDMNDFDQINIVQGPTMPSLLQTRATGGYIDIQTKKPYFDAFHGQATVMEGMYDQNLWQADVGAPIVKDKLAFRFSYLGNYSGSYYENNWLHNQSFYLALTYKPADNYEIFFNNSYYTEGFNELGGINRPTQQLISDGQYLSGVIPNAYLGSPVHGVNYNIGPAGFRYGVSVLPQNYDTLRYVPLDSIGGYRANFGFPGGGFVESERSQVLQKLAVDDGFEIRNNTQFQWFNYGYRNEVPYYLLIPDAWALQNKLDFLLTFDTPIGSAAKAQEGAPQAREPSLSIQHTVDVGFESDFVNMAQYSASAEEMANVWNMGPLDSAVYPGYFQYNLPGLPWYTKYTEQDVRVPGRPSWIFNPGSSTSNASEIWYLRPFWQHEIDFGKAFSIFMGASALTVLANAQSPPGTPSPYFDFGHAQYPMSSSFSSVDPNFDFSPRWKPNDWTTVYFDFQQAWFLFGGGAYGISPTATTSDFHQQQRLYSGGINFKLLGGKLNILTAAFDQTFEEVMTANRTSLVSVPFEITGATIQAALQPDKHLWLVANLSYILGTTTYASPLTSGPSMSQPYPSSFVAANPSLYPFDKFSSFPAGTYPLVGWPDFQASYMTSYTLDNGIGFFSSFNATSPQYLGYDYLVRIPWQYTLNFGVSYVSPDKHWTARLWLWNVTDQHNWIPNAAGFGPTFSNYDQILVSLPFWIQGQASYSF